MEKELSVLNAELADVAKEINADVVIEFNSIKATYKQEDFDNLRAKGLKPDVKTCIAYALLQAGKTEDEMLAFLQEAINSKKINIHVSFEIPEESRIHDISKENTPLFDELVQLVGSIQK